MLIFCSYINAGGSIVVWAKAIRTLKNFVTNIEAPQIYLRT